MVRVPAGDAPRTSSSGDVLVQIDVAGTVLFGATAAFAAISFSSAAQWVGAITAITLFAVGVVAFLWAYWNAVQRSRTDEISVIALYFLLGASTPRRVRLTMNLVLVAQVVIAAVTTFARPDGPDGNPGSSLALGFLVPMFGFGMNGLWAAYHAKFPPRDAGSSPAGAGSGAGDVPSGTPQIGQNADHG